MAWRTAGHRVCRHGVFFTSSQAANDCPCLASTVSQDLWRHAKFMPSIDVELKALVCVKFNAQSFLRLGVLQAELRRRG
eukprot:7867831-Karenia_brevis.AAC.1